MNMKLSLEMDTGRDIYERVNERVQDKRTLFSVHVCAKQPV